MLIPFKKYNGTQGLHYRPVSPTQSICTGVAHANEAETENHCLIKFAADKAKLSVFVVKETNEKMHF